MAVATRGDIAFTFFCISSKNTSNHVISKHKIFSICSFGGIFRFFPMMFNTFIFFSFLILKNKRNWQGKNLYVQTYSKTVLQHLHLSLKCNNFNFLVTTQKNPNLIISKFQRHLLHVEFTDIDRVQLHYQMCMRAEVLGIVFKTYSCLTVTTAENCILELFYTVISIQN